MMDGDNGPALKLERWEESVSHDNESQDQDQSASQPQKEERWFCSWQWLDLTF